MKNIILLLVILCAAPLYAQFLAPDAPIHQDAATQAYNNQRLAAVMANYYKRPFDVQRYDVYMDWRNPLNTMSVEYPAVNTITLVSDSAGLNSVLLDAAGMRIDSIRVNETLVAPVQPDVNEQINITLDKAYNLGDTITLVINYTHTSTNQQGFYLYDKNLYVGSGPGGDSIFTAERLAYTMSEPLDAHWWMPCMDLPYDKALSEMRVVVPDSFVVSSNGILQSVTPDSGGGNVFYWKENEPISTYLMCATSSIFSHWSAPYVRIANPHDTVPIYYYVWPVDSTNADTTQFVYNAAYCFRNIPQIMHGESQYFGEFPFSKYGMTAVQPFGYGGMEHQTMTTITRSWLHPTWGEQGMAHEMMHQWFGDDITCATWKDIWLNEGFATFGEDVYNEFMFGEGAYKSSVIQQVNGYFNNSPNGIAIYDPVGQGADIFNEATTYLKGGVVLYMLRSMLGDSSYFNAMHYYLNKFHYSAATTDDFAQAISEATGQDLHWFVNEWIYGKLQPLYNVGWWTAYQLNSWNINVQINQPDTTRQLFRMPVPLRLYRGTTAIDTVVIDSLRSQEFVINMPYPIDSLAFDPDYHILKEPTSTVTGITSSMLPSSSDLAIHVAPNPARENAILLYNISGEDHATLLVTDVLGRTVAEFPLGAQRQGIAEWNVQGVPAGVYYARLATAHGTATAQIEVMK